MENTTDRPDFLKQVLKFGIIIALVNIIITLFIYVVDVTMMVKWWFLLIIFVVNIILILYAGFEWRKLNGGFLPFKGAFSYIFSVLFVSGLIGLLFNILLYQVIDPDLPNTLKDASIEEMVSFMERFNVPDADIDRQVEEIEVKTMEQYSISGMFFSFLYSLIVYAVVALIIGAIVKKSKPEFEG